MPQCPVTDEPYELNSVSDLLHRYLFAELQPGHEILTQLIKHKELIRSWYGTVLRELGIHFMHTLETSKRKPPKNAYDLLIAKWNDLGLRFGIKYPQLNELTESLYKALLSYLRIAQGLWGWIPKGTAYHQIGWAKLITGRPEIVREAETYFTLAMVEDILSDLGGSEPVHGNEVPTEYRRKPAYAVLTKVYGRQDDYLDAVKSFVLRLSRKDWKHVLLRKAILENPELVWLEYASLGELPESSLTPRVQ